MRYSDLNYRSYKSSWPLHDDPLDWPKRFRNFQADGFDEWPMVPQREPPQKQKLNGLVVEQFEQTSPATNRVSRQWEVSHYCKACEVKWRRIRARRHDLLSHDTDHAQGNLVKTDWESRWYYGWNSYQWDFSRHSYSVTLGSGKPLVEERIFTSQCAC